MNKQIRFIPALVAGMAMLSISTMATAATTIDVIASSILVAKSAGVLVSLQVTCDSTFGPGSNLYINIGSLSQRTGNTIAQGNGIFTGLTINCDGTPQPV